MDEYSISKANYHLDRLQEIKKGNPIAPTLIQIDLEAWCNDNCSFCSYRKDDGYNKDMLKLIDGCSSDACSPIGRSSDKSRLPKSVAYSLPAEMKEAGVPAIELTGGGEPTMWPHFDILLKGLIENGIEIGLVTNGSNLPESRIKQMCEYEGTLWIRLSMDASTQEIHKKIHRTPGEDFERRLENIRKLVKYKHRDLVLGISFIITPDNQWDIKQSTILYKSLGVSNIRFSWMYDTSGTAGLKEVDIIRIKGTLVEMKEKYETPEFGVFFEIGRIDTYSRPNDDFKTCYYQRFVWNIGADGYVYPCCIQKYDPNFAFADIRTESVKEIIASTHSRMSTLDPKGCHPCWLRQRNKTIASNIEKPKHHNFI